MLAKRVIPTLLVRNGQLVKGAGFDSWRLIGIALQAAKVHAMRSVDELCILDISATLENRGPSLKIIEDLTKNCFVPITYGGGVRNLSDIKDLMNAGADKICLGTNALEHPALVKEASSKYGSQAIVVSIDVKDERVHSRCGSMKHGISARSYAMAMQDMGAGEILLTSIGRDGTMHGYDLSLIKQVSEAVSIPVIASGGCSGPEDMYHALQAGASAVSAGALFAFTDHTPRSCVEYLHGRGVPVRL